MIEAHELVEQKIRHHLQGIIYLRFKNLWQIESIPKPVSRYDFSFCRIYESKPILRHKNKIDTAIAYYSAVVDTSNNEVYFVDLSRWKVSIT